MFDQLTARLTEAIQRVTGRGRITEENVRDTVRTIRMALLEADVALPVAKALVDRVRDRALGEEVARSLNPGQAFVKIVHDELVAVLGGDSSPLNPHGHPAVIMLVGLQGAGKTTTAAKLARHTDDDARRRRAAREHRRVSACGARSACDVGGRPRRRLLTRARATRPRAIAREALAAAQRGGQRWLILDTAGRLHVDAEMMNEARELHALVAPGETLFVVDSMAGQDAVNSARAFHEALPLTGVILTKTDGDARGGVALSVREVTGLPIKLVGTGEKVDALEPFVPTRFASRILGMGDVVGLVEQVQKTVDREEMERLAGKVKQGSGLSLDGLPRAAAAAGQHGRPRATPRQAAGAQARAARGRQVRPEAVPPPDRHHRLDDPGRAAPAGPHRRLAQTADRGGRRACRSRTSAGC